MLVDIVQGHFNGLLPSIRELVQRYGLNPVSIHRGITLLTKRGILVSRGSRRRHAIAETVVGDQPCGCKQLGIPCCRPIIFVGAEPSEVNAALMMATYDIQQASRANGGNCITVVLSGMSQDEKLELVRTVLMQHKPTHALLLYCDQLVYEIIVRRRIKVGVIGGSVTSRRAVNLNVDMTMLGIAAFDHLRQLGHRKFRLMMLARKGAQQDFKYLRDFSSEKGVEAEGVFEGELDMATMSRELARALRENVTAFAFPRPEDLVLATAYFDTVGVKFPRDISVVMLLNGPYDFMKTKQPAHFKITKDAIKSLVLGWFEYGENRSERVTRDVIASYVEGATVGPVKNGSLAHATRTLA